MAVDYLSALNAGSGLNVTQIVDSLVDAERVPREKEIENSREEATVSISALGSLKQEMSLYQTNTNALNGQIGLSLSSNNDNIVIQRSENSVAKEFNHSINVSEIARSHVVNFSGYNSVSADLNIDQLTIDFGQWTSGSTFTANGDLSQESFTFSAGSRSLTDIKNAINGSGAGITANIIEVSTGNFSLVIKSKMGASKEIKVKSYLNSIENSVVKFDPSNGSLPDVGATSITGKDAAFTLDGVAITRDTNNITDVLEGIDLELKGTTSSEALIAASYNEADGLATLQTLVDETNFLLNFLREQVAPGEDGENNGPLHNDHFTRSIETKIKSLTTTAIAGFDNENIYLSSLGIMTRRDGTLEIDESRFKQYFAENPSHLSSVTTSMIRSADNVVDASSTVNLFTPGAYNFVLSSGTATIDGDVMTGGPNRWTVTTGNAKGLLVDTNKSSADTTIFMGRSLVEELSDYIDTVLRMNGDLDTKKANFENQVADLDKELEKLNEQMEKQRDLHLAKFTAMQTAVSRFKETGNFLDNFIKSWQSSN